MHRVREEKLFDLVKVKVGFGLETIQTFLMQACRFALKTHEGGGRRRSTKKFLNVAQSEQKK